MKKAVFAVVAVVHNRMPVVISQMADDTIYDHLHHSQARDRLTYDFVYFDRVQSCLSIVHQDLYVIHIASRIPTWCLSVPKAHEAVPYRHVAIYRPAVSTTN